MLRIRIRLTIHELPKRSHILLQLTKDQVSAVAADIPFVGIIFRPRQFCSCSIARIDQRTVSILRIFIRKPQNELSKRYQVAVFELIALLEISSTVPIDLWLADAIHETKLLDAAKVRGR